MVVRPDADTIGNRILLALPEQERKELLQHLRPIELKRGWQICHAGKEVQDLFFIDRGLVSLIKRMKNGEAVEIGARGIEGITAPETIMGVHFPLYDAVVQLPGFAHAIRKSVLEAELRKRGRLRALILGYIHAAASQIAQTSACNRLHLLEQRCCRWLLIAHDNAQADTFSITHEFLAMMLGVHRPGVSLAMHKFQEDGMLKYERGRLTIIDRAQLEKAACECYQTIRDEFDSLFRQHKSVDIAVASPSVPSKRCESAEPS